MLAYANSSITLQHIITTQQRVIKEESMSKVAIVYWSGTGNTQSMAEAVKAGALSSGASVGFLF